MKRVILISILIIISFNYLKAQTYGLDNADPAVFSKFKVPDTDLRSLWINTSMSLHTNKNIQDYYYNLNSYNSELYFNLNPNYYLLNETDNRYMSLSANLYGTYDKLYSENKASYEQTTNVNKSNYYSSSLSTHFILNNYINPENVFYSLGSDINVNISDNKREDDQAAQTSYYTGYKNQAYNFSFGIGIGKLRNVTSVVSALRFQERLKQMNMLNGNLSESTIEDLARQFYKQIYYSQVYDRPDKYFWQDINKTLSNDGVSLNDLNMYADNYLRETVNEVRFMRHEGFMAGADIQLNYQNYYNSSTLPKIAEQFYTLGNLYLDYSHQLDLNSQFSFNISLSGGPNILSSPVIRQMYSTMTGISYSYELTDRLVATVSNSFNLIFYNENNKTKNLENTFNIITKYFIEDNLSLNASYEWHYFDNRTFSLVKSTSIYNSVSLGFTYYFERGFLYQ